MNHDTLFGEIAVREGYLTREQLEACGPAPHGIPLPRVLINRGLLTEEDARTIDDIRRVHAADADQPDDAGEFQRDDRFVLRCPSCDTYTLVQNRTEGASVPCPKCARVLTVRRAPLPQASTDTLRLGTSIGPYTPLRMIGRGGMCVVYKALHRETKDVVALKVLKDRDAPTAEVLRRFRQEAQAARRLSHPNIVAVSDAGEADGRSYIAMDLVEGHTLEELVTQRKILLPQFVAVLEKTARAVHHAHQSGIIHRDLKPANILIDSAGEPHVTDFGLAKLDVPEEGQTHAGVLVGTPHYMSPEQVEGDVAGTDARSDIYCLGVLLYEALTGQVPNPGASAIEVYRSILTGDPPPPRAVNPSAPAALEATCMRALQRDKNQRYATAQDFAEDLKRWRKPTNP